MAATRETLFSASPTEDFPPPEPMRSIGGWRGPSSMADRFHQDSRHSAVQRIVHWRQADAQRQQQQEQSQRLVPWWRTRETKANAVRINLWRDEALEKPTPPRALGTSTATPLSEAVRGEQMLGWRLAEFSQLVGRLRRFTLLNEERESRSSTVLAEVASLDECRSLIADLICALRIAMVTVVEAVNYCADEQANDTHLNLNLPRLRKHFAPAVERDRRRLNAIVGVTGSAAAESDAAAAGLSAFSSERHAAILCSLPQQVAAFLPLPFMQDPLLLHWFDENAEIWQTSTSMPAVKASRSVQHAHNDKKRMQAAQTQILESLRKSSSPIYTQPRVLPPPRCLTECPASAVASPASPRLPSRPSSRMDSTRVGSARGVGSRINDEIRRELVTSGLARPPSRGVTANGTLPTSASAPVLAPLTSLAVHASHHGREQLGVRTMRDSTALPPLARPSTASAVVAPAHPAVGRPARPATASSASRSNDEGGDMAFECTAVGGAGMEAAADAAEPEARVRARARARAMWHGMECLIYGGSDLYANALQRLSAKKAEDARQRSFNARAHTIIAIGGTLDEDTKVTLVVRKLQRVWRKRHQQQQENRHRKAEQTATIAILSGSRSLQAKRLSGTIGLSSSPTARRTREHLALVERVAAYRILAFFRSAKYQGHHKEREAQTIILQSKVRRFLASRSLSRAFQRQALEEKKQLLATLAVRNAERYASVIQGIYQDYKVTSAAKYVAFQTQNAAVRCSLAAMVSDSPDAQAMHELVSGIERQSQLVRRDVAIKCGTLASSGTRPEPLTTEVLDRTSAELAENVRLAIVEASGDGVRGPPPKAVAEWVAAMERRSNLEGAISAMATLEGCWPTAPALIGQQAMLRQQLRAGPPMAPGRVRIDHPAVQATLQALADWGAACGAAAVINSYHVVWYDELLLRLSVQRQDALKASLRLEFCHQLRSMRKRYSLICLCDAELERLQTFVPITTHDAAVKMYLRCDDWTGKRPPIFNEEAAATLCEEMRDWFSVPSSIGLRAVKVGEQGKNILEVEMTIFGKVPDGRPASPTRRRIVPPSPAALASVGLVLEQLTEMNTDRLEKGRLPDLAAMWGCTYIGLEIRDARAAYTEIHREATLQEHITRARDDFAVVQRTLDEMGAEKRTREWANQRKWHFLEGAVAWLKNETTQELGAVGISLSKRDDAPSDPAAPGNGAAELPSYKVALEAKVASRMRWTAVRELVRVQEQHKRAEKQKSERKSAVSKQQDAAAREMLMIQLLDTSASELKDLSWRTEGYIDIRYNLGLPALGEKRPPPLASSVGGGITLAAPTIQQRMDPPGKPVKLCYYCAGGLGGAHRPVSAAHPMWACPVRLQQGVREFPPVALERVQLSLKAEGDVLRRAITEHAAANMEAKLSRKASFQLGGVCSVIANARERHAPQHAESRPSLLDKPASRGGYLYSVLADLRRERAFWSKALVVSIARDARVSGYPRLADFKGLAVLQGPLGTVADGSQQVPLLTPARVLDAADEIGLLAGLVGSMQGLGAPPPGKTTLSAPYRALWVAAEFALAPLPALWTVVVRDEGSGGGRAGAVRYQKTDLGEVTEREEHPLRDAYHTTAKRIIRYSPQLSLKQQPMLSWHLFSIDGLPRCVNMQAAAKRRFRFGRSWQASPDKPNVSLAKESGAAATPNTSPSLPPSSSQQRLSARTAPVAAPAAAPPSDAAPTSAAARGLHLCTFPPLSKFPRMEFAPQKSPEQVAARFAELSQQTITHAASERHAERRAVREQRREEEVAHARAHPRRAKLTLGVRTNGSVRLSVHVLTAAEASTDGDEAVDEVLELATCVLEEIDKLRLTFDRHRAHSLHVMSRSLEEVLTMAAYLGLPYGGELGTEQLWIADAALCPQLPLGWTSHVIDDDESTWYENIITGERMWEHPQVAFLRGVATAASITNDVLHPVPIPSEVPVVDKRRSASFVSRNLKRQQESFSELQSLLARN